MAKIALVGCGGMANAHAEQLKKIEEAQVVALVDTVAAQTRLFKERHFPNAAEYESYEQLLDEPPAGGLDAVVLVTPHTLHYAQAKAALERGLHVLCEKPMVTSSEHAYGLWKVQKTSGKLLGVAYQSPYTAEFGYFAQERDAGRLGTFQLITGWLSQGWMKGTRGKWRQDPALSGGGQMYDSGAHLLNAFMWLMNSPVTEVGCFYDKVEAPVDINGVAICRFQNGCLGSITIGGNCPPFGTEIVVQTDTMRIHTNQYGGKLEMHGRGGKPIYPHVQPLPAGGGTPHHNFVNAIAGREPLKCPIRYGVLLSALMDAMYESGESGKMVKVKPVPEDI